MMSQKGSRFKNFEIPTSLSVFSPKKTYPYQFFRSKQSFYRLLLSFWWILEILVKLGSMTSQKGSRFKNFEILKSSSFFSRQKAYICQFLEQNDYFIVFYWVFGEFWASLGKIGRQWRHKRGQDLKISKLWHHHRFSLPQKHTHTNF